MSDALCESEEHNIKLVMVCQILWRRYGKQTIYRIAAGHFVPTPPVKKRDVEGVKKRIFELRAERDLKN